MKLVYSLILFMLLVIPVLARTPLKLNAIPFLPSWHNKPNFFQVTDEGTFVIAGDKASLLFDNPQDVSPPRSNDEIINKCISTIPHSLIVHNFPIDYKIEGDLVRITAAGKTNLFNSPSGKSKVVDAPLILFEPESDFTMSAKITADLKSIYDVAALVIYKDDDMWAKFCYENSVNLEPTIVSVVTRTLSDDCNSMRADDYAYMAVVKKGTEYSFFYSSDNKNWLMVRNFNLPAEEGVKVGFGVHGSRGNGLTGTFSDIKYLPEALDDMRMLSNE